MSKIQGSHILKVSKNQSTRTNQISNSKFQISHRQLNLICINASMIINSPEVYITEQFFDHEEGTHSNCYLLYKFILHRTAYQ